MFAAGSDGIQRDVNGGKPMVIDGKMALCGRSDDTSQRGYTGSLAELAIWDTVLTADQVSAIYKSVSMLHSFACCPMHRPFMDAFHARTALLHEVLLVTNTPTRLCLIYCQQHWR